MGSREPLVIAGNYLQIAIPCMGFAVSIFRRDREGFGQFTGALILMVIVVQGIKFFTGDWAIGVRPYGGTKSFPSGHAAASFQGAFFLYRRYGWRWGAPMVVLAALTAYSRIYGQYHHWRDVIVGFSIAFLIDRLFVFPPAKGISKGTPSP
ncbi:MAG: phosphatase PAP2 family protein [Puniceicoccales bacterium]|nr:phosphatase PAP2 family protein [Puniceicoccales bacterium]